MGPELAAAAPYLVAGGTALSLIGESQANKKRQKIIGRQLEETSKTQDKSTQDVLGEAANFTGEKRRAAMQSAEDAAYDQAQKDIDATGAGIVDVSGKGRVSDDFIKAKADKTLSEGNRLSALAREIAKTRAPSDLTREEAMRRANLTEKIGSRWSTTRNMGQAAQLDAGAVGTPWYGTLGKLAAALGSGGIAGAYSKPANPWNVPGSL